MKIIYINGYKEVPDPSLTYEWLRKNLTNDEIIECSWYYNNGINLKKIDECVKKANPDIIVASSTGGLIASRYDIPKILINPVIDRKDLEKLHTGRSFQNLPKKIEKVGDVNIVILSKNDERLNYKKALKIFKDAWIVDDTHRLQNKDILLQALNNIKEFIENLTYIEG